MKVTLLIIMMILISACQVKSGATSEGGGLFTGHVPVANQFTLSTPLNSTYFVGQTINFNLAFPLPVTISGTPTLSLTIGASSRTATYVSGNGSTSLVFSYTVGAGENDTDGISVAASMNLPGGATCLFNTSETCNVTIDVPSLVSVRVLSSLAPVANNITPAAFNEDTSSTITLSYTDAESDLATSCSLSSLVKVTVTTPCACNGAGVCTVGVTGVSNANGASGFSYNVIAGSVSNTASASFNINPVADVPIVTNLTPAAFNEDVQSIISLPYFDGDNDLATSCSVSTPTNVTVTQACACNAGGVCTVGVTGSPLNYNGAASFVYNVTANSQVSNSATTSLTITGVGDAPVAAAITPPAFNEDIQSIITLSYTDGDNDKATACTITSPTNVSVTQACACNGAGVCTAGVTGSPLHRNGAASFAYTVTANAQVSNSVVATLSITPVPDAPVAANITPPAFNANTQSIITLSYLDPESDLAGTCAISSPTNVTVTQACACNGAGVCTVGVTGTFNYSGAASFAYTVTANGLTSNSATASLVVNPLASAPVASNITPAAFNEDVQSIIALNYTDANSDLASGCAISAPTNVTVTQACSCDGLGVCTVGVTGTAHYNGSAGFGYTVTANGDTSNTATAALTILSVADLPVAVAITPAAFNENTQSIMTLSYSDPDSDLASVCTISGLTNVTVTQACACNGAGVCTVGVTGALNYNGAASFNYTVTANGGVSNSVSSTFVINNVANAPVATNITPAAFNEDTQSVMTLAYTDGDSDLATACTISALNNVTVTQACACDGAGVCTVGVTGSPLHRNGAASFSYTVTANSAVSNTATSTFTMTPVADMPVAVAITPASFNENTQSIMTLTYSDADNDLGSACTITGLTNVTVTQACACNGAGVCTVGVTGTTNYSGAASFNYTVTANGDISNSVSSTFTINDVANAPVATNITPAAFNEDTQSIMTLAYTDADSDLATACTISGLSNVSVTQACACNGAGVCTVGVTGSPLHRNGAASFSYTVTANSVVSNTATSTFTITPVADMPVATNITPAAFNENTQSVMTLAYTDADTDLATACTITTPTNVTVTQACACNGAGLCTVGVTGTLNYNGAASFAYTVTANGDISNSATSTFTINNLDNAPVATNITPATFNEDTQSIMTLAYTDADSDLATACTISGLSNVSVTQACACNGAGVCTVGVTGSPLHRNGAASFSYTVTANSVVSNTATSTFTITPVADMPVATNITPAAFNENTQSVMTLAYTDADADLATACTISTPTNVTVTQACACNGAGLCTVGVTGTLNYNGAASFAYTVTANGDISNSATSTFTINNVDNAPVATNITPAAFNEDTQSIMTLAYTDGDSDLATACTISALNNVTVTQACACDGAGVCTVGVTGSPLNRNGAASFSYTVTANSVASNTATSTFTITPVADMPVATNITPAAFNENTQSIMNLAYTDGDTDLATACTITTPTNITVTQACACNGAGVCTVGVTGMLNYNGAASFAYTVTANGNISNSATSTFTINNVDNAPVAVALTPTAFNEDSASTMTLSYSDADNDKATTCTISALSNVTVSTPCACDGAGVCTVGVTGAANYAGTGSFNYTVTANSAVSNSVSSTFTINQIDDAPVATPIAPADINKNVQGIMTLAYTDVENHNAATCSLTGLSNVTVTQACACNGSGVCTVGVTGNLNYTGTAGFNYSVTANGLTSNSSTSTFNIISVAPVANNITPPAFNEDVQSIITLNYTDADNDKATTCTPSSLSNVTVTQACACNGAGVCTVGVTGTTNTNGAASFSYIVNAGGQNSNTATATLSITSIDDAPTGIPLTPAAFDEDIESPFIELTYSDAEGGSASSCAVTSPTNVTITTACTCTVGTCTVKVTGNPTHYYGTASFNYTVTVNGLTSAPQPASLTISPVSDAPTTANLTPTAFNEDTQSIITLTHTVVGGDTATSCAIASPTNVTVTQACACASGTCTVGVTGNPNYFGTASFQWTVSAGSAQSTSKAANLTVTSVNDLPTLSAISAQTTPRGVNTAAIGFTFSDVETVPACSSARLTMTSSNTAVVANGAVTWAGTSPNCTAIITPVGGAIGVTTITITGTDVNSGAGTTSFQLTVEGVVLEWQYNANGTSVSTHTFASAGGGNVTVILDVRNIGNIPTPAAVTITETPIANGGRVTVLTDTCTAAVPVNGVCTLTVQLSYNGGGGNTRTKDFTATSGGSTDTVRVTGTKI